MSRSTIEPRSISSARRLAAGRCVSPATAAGTGRSMLSGTKWIASCRSSSGFRSLAKKAQDFELYRQAVGLLDQRVLSEPDYRTVLALRERMNRGGKRRYRMARILRDYTPTSPASGVR